MIRDAACVCTTLLGFETTYESDWYVSLPQLEPPHFELALVDAGHETVPEAFRRPPAPDGVLIDIITLIAPTAEYATASTHRPEG